MGYNEYSMATFKLSEHFSRFLILLYTTWFGFVVGYRKTIIGPIWLVAGPALFILSLGFLFSRVNGIAAEIFIPHLTVGLIIWTLMGNFVNNSATIFQRMRTQVLQGGLTLHNIVVVDLLSNIIAFLHQVVIIALVMLIYSIGVTAYSFVSIIGLLLILINGYWITYFFGIIGARYRDLDEVFQMVMRIAFLATPIIWMPGTDGRGGIVGSFLTFNPFYHFLELVRAPLLGNEIEWLSWAVVLGITGTGVVLARLFYMRFSRYVPLWV